MNKILVPIDFSDTSQNALFYAIGLFGKLDVEITILNTYEVHQKAGSLKSMDKVLREDAQTEIADLVDKIKKKEPDVVLNQMILKGDAVTTIARLGNSGKYDFIVMGTKGATGLKEVFIGSVAGGVISKTSAPVLVVPGSQQYRPLDEIAFAVSGIPFSNASIVEPLRKIAKLCSCKINVLRIAKEKTSDMEEILATIEDLHASVVYAFGTSNINQHINDYLMKSNAGLLCLVRRKKGFFKRIFVESVTLKQTFNSPVPILILHN